MPREIGVEHLPPILFSMFEKRLYNPATRVIREDVDRPEPVLDFRRHVADLLGTANVGRNRKRLATGLADNADRIVGLHRIQINHCHTGPFPREGQRDGPSDSHRAARNDGVLVFKPHRTVSLDQFPGAEPEHGRCSDHVCAAIDIERHACNKLCLLGRQE